MGKGPQQLSELIHLERLMILQTGLTDASMATVANMTRLKFALLNGHPITDDGFQVLQSLRDLEALHLSDTLISDPSLAIIAGMPYLRKLVVSGTRITDSGMEELKPLGELEYLDIRRTAITDQGLEHLHGHERLTKLEIDINSHITPAAVDRLKAKLPSCQIDCWETQPGGTGVLLSN